jgi:short-subunit dehydrogenase
MDRNTRPLALVTGASSGIGTALARELARHGHDLVLTARRAAPMGELAAELRALGAGASVIPADLSKPGAAAALADDLAARGLDIDILVNNAGLGALGRFDRMDSGRIGDMLQVNIIALTELTRLLLPGMIARGHGRIMLVSSVAGFQPGPRMAVYFATKAYVTSLGEALAYELRRTGVSVTVLCPGATETEFFAVAGATNSSMAARMRRMMRAEDVARIGYRGLAAGRRLVIAGVMNKVLGLAGHLAPHRLSLPFTDMLMMSPRDERAG